MPVDPSISMQVHGGATGPANAGFAPAGGAPSNPLSLAEGFAGLQEKMNSINLFNQQMKARKRLGEIMATSKDIPSAVQAAQGDSQVNAFLPGELASIMGTLEAGQRYKGEVTHQSQDALGAVMSTLGTGFTDPDQLSTMMAARLKAIADPVIRAKTTQTASQLLTTLTDDLPADPEAKKAEYAKRLTGMAQGTAIPGVMEAMRTAWGATETQDQGNRKLLGVRAPSFPTIMNSAPGSFAPAGGAPVNELQMRAPPSVGQTPSGGHVEFLDNGSELHMAGIPVAGNGPTGQPMDQTSANGDPLVPKGFEMKSPSASLPKSAEGIPIRSAEETKAVNDRLSDWNTKDKEVFDNAQSTKGLLEEVKSNYDQLAKGGGFLIPGTGGDLRLDLGKLVNTVAAMTGKENIDLPVDPKKIASGEDLNKDTWRLGTTALRFMLGQQREAAETIKSAIGAVPNIDNTYFGGKFISAMLGAMADRAIDQRYFESQWQADPNNRGDLRGSEIAFSKLHPATDYVKRVLNEFGMTENGFRDRPALEEAVKNKLISPEQAIEIAKKQGFKLGK